MASSVALRPRRASQSSPEGASQVTARLMMCPRGVRDRRAPASVERPERAVEPVMIKDLLRLPLVSANPLAKQAGGVPLPAQVVERLWRDDGPGRQALSPQVLLELAL